jgi:hypothetical protein
VKKLDEMLPTMITIKIKIRITVNSCLISPYPTVVMVIMMSYMEFRYVNEWANVSGLNVNIKNGIIKTHSPYTIKGDLNPFYFRKHFIA